MTAHCVLLLIVVKPCPGREPRCLEGSRPVTFFPKGLLRKEKDFVGGVQVGGISRYMGEVLTGELLAIPHIFPEGPLKKRERLRWWGSGGISRYTGEVLTGELLAIPLDCKLQANWRASEASETPSIATYREKCMDGTSKPKCACSQFYVKRRCGRARSQLAVRECN